MVERGYSHSRNLRKFLHVQRLGVVGPEPGDGSCRSVAQVACRGDGAQPFSLRGAQDAVDDFTLDQVAEKRNILGSLEKLDQPRAGTQQTDGRFADCQSARSNRGLGFRKSSRLMTSRTVGISSRRNIESSGTCSEASTIWLSAGTSIEERRKDDPSQR